MNTIEHLLVAVILDAHTRGDDMTQVAKEAAQAYAAGLDAYRSSATSSEADSLAREPYAKLPGG